MILSIDQNSHPLWDAAAKVQALVRAGREVRHLVEDVDTAFTRVGGQAGDPLGLRRETYHHSGGADWGAALFYSLFLGRQPLNVRTLEPYLGMKLSALARQAGSSVESLYEEFSPGDNWQLVGPSYAGDARYHRVIGDLGVGETAPFLREILSLARRDTLERFCARDAQERTADWFDRQQAMLEELLAAHEGGTLVDLYRDWMTRCCAEAEVALASSLGDTSAPPAGAELLELFLRDYDRAAALYNESIAEAADYLRPLRIDEGELPMFAIVERDGRPRRAGMSLDGGRLRVGEREFPLPGDRGLPLDALREGGVRCVLGKAVLLVIQVRLGPGGCPLALPLHGSVYVPAAHALTRKLAAGKLLDPPSCPILRVRLRLLDRLGELDTPIRLPDYLSEATNRDEVSSRELARSWRDWTIQAAGRLEMFRDPAGRQVWQRQACRDLLDQIDRLDARRRDLARVDPKSNEVRELSHRSRTLQGQLLDRTFRQVVRDWQVCQLDYWDSRGAILPWAHAAGGEPFVKHVLDQAEISEEWDSIVN